jgi:hypothetical protein
MKKHIHNPPLVIAFAVIFVITFIIKAAIHDVIGTQFITFLATIFSVFPEIVQYFLIMGISYILVFPIWWTMDVTGLHNITTNQFGRFVIDIALTMTFFAMVYAVIRKLFFRTTQHSKKST